MGILLFIVAVLLLGILVFPVIVYGAIKDRLNDNLYFLSLAEAIDRFGNVLCAPLFDKILVRATIGDRGKTIPPYLFGIGKETISSCLGKNLQRHTLSKTGLFLVNILNSLQKDHCINSIDNNV